MIKLITIDLDGTLLNNEMEVSVQNLEALQYAKEKGVHVAIATGRPLVFTKAYMKQLGLDTYILYNGAQIIHKNQDLVPSTYLSKDIIKTTINAIEKLHSSYMLHGQDTVFYTPSKRVEYLKMMSQKIKEKNLRPKFEIVEDLDLILEEHDFNKVLVVEQDPEKYNVVHRYLTETLSNVEITRSSSFYIEVLPKGIAKGNAVKILAEHLGIKQEDIMAIGDQENDLSMITYAGIGVAMGNATDLVKNTANYVTFTNNENGVSKAIKNFL